MYVHEDLILPSIIDCKTSTVATFKTKLGLNQHDIILNKEQSVSTKIRTVFSDEVISLQRYVLNKHKIDQYFPENKLAVEFDEKVHKCRDKDREIKKEKAIKSIFVATLLELIPMIRILIFFLVQAECTITLKNLHCACNKLVNRYR